MSVAQPAWQTEELQEEWVDLEPEECDDDDDLTYGTQSISLTAPLSTHIHTHSDLDGEGTPLTSNASRAGGTFLVREDVAKISVLPKTPAWNKKGLIKDFFTPLPLERMFDPPTPPNYASSNHGQNSGTTPSPPQSAVLVTEKGGADRKQEDEILETDMPNVQSFHGRKASMACQFTFSVPREALTRPRGLCQSNYPQAQSTPNPPANNGLSAPPTDSRLRLFQFQYDTYTRDHLSAMVDSIAINTPSGSGTTGSPPTNNQHLSRVSEITGTSGDFTHLRSAKRIKLSLASEFYGEGAGMGATISRPKLTGKDYVGESRSLMEKIKQARDFSTISTVASAKASPTSESKFSAGHDSNVAVRATSQSTRRPSLLSVPDSRTDNIASSSSNTLTSKSNSYSSNHYRLNAAALMDQIKNDMKGQKRIFSGDTDTSTITTQPDDQTDSTQRSNASRTGHRRQPKPEEKENQGMGLNNSSQRRASSSKSNGSRTPRKQANRVVSDETSQALVHSLSRMAVTDHEIHRAAPSTTERQSHTRPPSTLAPPSHPSSSVRAGNNDDLNRFVSSSTASGTTITASSAPSFVKHAGPPHLRTIAPTDLPPLPERLGDMLFDKVLMKWVKNTGQVARDPDRSGASIAEMSDDPFGDIESLHDDSRGRDPMAGAETADVQEESPISAPEMTAIEERSEADDEELELMSFSTDASAHVVDIMTGVDTTGYNDGDETTDSDDNEELDGTVTTRIVPVVVDYESGDEDVSPTDPHYAVRASTQVATSSAHPPPPPIPYLITPNKRTGAYVSNTPLRSALKSHSATPNSAFKSQSRSRYRTPNQKRHRRSVSFSDGKRDGPIQGLGSSPESEAYSGRAGAGLTNVTQPSARSKRIADMMDALANSDFSDEASPSKSSSTGRPEELQPLGARQQAVIPAGNTSQQSTSRRTFSRSHTHRISPRKSFNRANGTFLTECSFGVAHDRLVEVITDVQPFEPHWEQLSAIDLSNKNLESVARLKEFLPQLDSLNINSNQLSWLSGVPLSVRTLSVARNSLTGLTSYSHLLNLENLDISHNEVESLRQLECLKHLRELKADGNKITSLDGLQRMDGLVKLSLQANSIKSLDLTQSRWTRLEMLNISHNRLDSIRGLSSLQSLIAVNLDSNLLKELTFGNGMPRLRILRVSSNRLSELQMAGLPNLRTLYADNNALNTITKVERLTRLENLSLRNQSGRKFNFLTRDVRDVKRLYLSGNPLKTPILSEPCYNLVYLELAACRLTALPEEGFSKLAPNLRVLNLNYNFLEDVKPLEGLSRLQKLTIIGSRLKSTKPLIRLLQRMPDVEMLDFRMNPCTLGWYLPLLVKDLPGALQPSEEKAVQEGGGSRKGGSSAASGGAPATGAKGATTQAWQDLDAKFRRDLPDECYVGRLAYRGLIMRACPRIRLLDGVAVTEKERMKAQDLLQSILGRGKKAVS